MPDEWARLLNAIEPGDENTSSPGSFVLAFPNTPTVVWDSLTGAFKRPETDIKQKEAL